jgi:hypothetical protein
MMTTYLPGTGATFEAVFTGDANPITVAVYDSAGAALLAPTPYGIAHIGVGQYLFTWPIPADQGQDTLSVVWSATVSGVAESSQEFFDVSPSGGAGAWCSVADVLAFTGGTVEQIDVTVAQQWMEALVHRVWRPTDSTRRDFYWLTRATAWQALYVNAHPELKTMMDVVSISQDGLSITFKGSTQSVAIYSPVAMRFLSNRFNSAFQKNRLTKVGVTAGSSIPWNNL